jgi:phosphoglycerol transferase MdoB-like AlkP superfamily enzyme
MSKINKPGLLEPMKLPSFVVLFREGLTTALNIMLIKLKIPKTILWVINLFFIFLLIFTLFRLATFFAFKPRDLSFTDMLPSFLLGIRYDLRWVAIILLPIVFFSLIPKLSPFYSRKNKIGWTWYLAVMTFLTFFFFAADFGNFSYNNTRLDAGALNFYEDSRIALQMLWQTYPMTWMLLGLVIAVLFFRWMFRRSHWTVINRTEGLGIPYKRKWFVIASVCLGLFVYGSLNFGPLTWKRAFVLHDNFKSYLALNPLQNFFATLKFRRPQFNEGKAREYFPLMSDWMQLQDKSKFNYHRQIMPGSNSLESHPNIVLVLCESFSMYKSSMSGNPLNTTPFFNEMCNNGIFFEKCFSPHYGTARGLFAILTGIPDAQLYKFSTRNPLALQQHTIINNFQGYDKYYFLGGSPGFNNFEGLLHNIDGLQMVTEGKFHSPKINVWGISDKNLFFEANERLKNETKPFFAIIQTADNHRPFMIPQEDSAFEKQNVPVDTLRKYGFETVNEFNSFRYSDYCFRKFMEAASKENYFHNTIFVFIGDHGVSGNANAMYPSAWTDQRLTDEHIPLLFYAPYLLHPQRRKEVVSQIDVLPTIAGMIEEPYINTTLGRDLLDPSLKNNYAFIVNQDGTIGMVTDNYYFTKNVNFPEEQLFSIQGNSLNYTWQEQKAIRTKMSEITTAYYETARWMLMNNKPLKSP